MEKVASILRTPPLRRSQALGFASLTQLHSSRECRVHDSIPDGRTAEELLNC